MVATGAYGCRRSCSNTKASPSRNRQRPSKCLGKCSAGALPGRSLACVLASSLCCLFLRMKWRAQPQCHGVVTDPESQSGLRLEIWVVLAAAPAPAPAGTTSASCLGHRIATQHSAASMYRAQSLIAVGGVSMNHRSIVYPRQRPDSAWE